jgi:hypothetical protein
MKKFLAVAILAVFAAFGFAPKASAQLNATGSLNVTVTVQQQSTIALSESGALTFDPVSGQTGNVTFNVKWNIGPVNNVNMYTYFSNAASALSATGGSAIPSSDISATFSGGVSTSLGKPCNQSYGVGNGVVDGASCEVLNVASTGNSTVSNTTPNNNFPSGGMNVTYSLSLLNYSGNGLKLPAGSYTGTLNAVVLAI